MAKIYGFNDTDVIGLAEFIGKSEAQSLTKTFRDFAAKTGKAQGTVRNMYYALAKHSQKDGEFTKKYLGGTPLSVGKIEEFSKAEEEDLMNKILELKSQGMSVRGAINSLANGDIKLALRYQNKFRNVIKNNPELAKNIQKSQKNSQNAQKTVGLSDDEYLRLKKEIDGLVSRISLKVKQENELLKARIEVLELENLRLNNLIYSSENAKRALALLRTEKEGKVLN